MSVEQIKEVEHSVLSLNLRTDHQHPNISDFLKCVENIQIYSYAENKKFSPDYE